MTDLPGGQLNEGKEAYIQAQKKRNLYIGLALFGFVVLVFFISMVRMSQGLKNDAKRATEVRSSISASK